MTPPLAFLLLATRVQYTGPDRGPGHPGATGTVLDVSYPDPADPDAVCMSVLWSDQDDARNYTVTPDTVDLWTLLPPEGAAPSSIAEPLTAADAALNDARSSHTTRGRSPEHLKALDALDALAARLLDLAWAFTSLPWAMDDEQRIEAGEGDALNDWRLAAGNHIADAAAVVWNAWQRETHASLGIPDHVRFDVILNPLRAVSNPLAVAHHTLDPQEGLVDG